MDRDGILKQLGEQKCGIYCQYEEKAEEVTGEIRHCKKKGRWFVAAQLSTFLLAMISIAIYAMYYAEMIIIASGIFFVLAYIAARRLDYANSEKLERLIIGSSRAREFHPHPLTEPCVKVSPHTALHTQLFVHRHNLAQMVLLLSSYPPLCFRVV